MSGDRNAPTPTDEEIRALARQDPRLREGELEFDPQAAISRGDDNGAYVQAWLWVSFSGTPLDQDAEGR